MPVEEMPVWMQAQQQNRARMEEEKSTNRAGWSPQQWDRGLRDALQVGSRHGANPGEWEYDINGEWVNQQTYDDPLWRQNIFDPWQQGIRDQWAGNRETADKWNRSQQTARGRYARESRDRRAADERGRNPYGRSRGIGTRSGRGGGMGSTSSRGAPRYDPAMIAQLIGG